MSIIWMFLVGCVVPVLSKVFWPKATPDDTFVAVLLGVTGSFTAGLIARAVGLANVAAGLGAIVASVLGAMLLPSGYCAVRSKFGRGSAGA